MELFFGLLHYSQFFLIVTMNQMSKVEKITGEIPPSKTPSLL